MVKKRVIALAFSDLHINDWAKFNENNQRTLSHFSALYLIKKVCLKYGCPALFCGDLFHKPENMSLGLARDVVEHFGQLDITSWDMWCISGNHDISKMVQVGKPMPPSWVEVMSKQYNFIKDLDFKSKENKDIAVYGVPHIDHNIGLNDYIQGLKLSSTKKNILLLHTDYPGAKDTDGSEVGTSENLNTNLLNRFDLTLIGHIHKPQRLGKKVYMVGAPMQQRRTDKNCDLGYWLIYEDLTLKFHPFDTFPKFIDVTSEDQIKQDGNYYTVISNKVAQSEAKVENTLRRSLSKKRIVRRYLKDQGIADPKKKSILLDIIKESEND